MKTLQTYFPLFILVCIILGISTIIQYYRYATRDRMSRMHIMMGIWFIAFGILKLPDIKGFQESFAMYDIVAREFPVRGLLYPFIEIALGVGYILQPHGTFAIILYSFTLLISGVGIRGIAEKLIHKQRIQCACMGTLFSFPLSGVSLFENMIMFVMALRMLIDMNSMEMVMMNM